MSGRLVMNKELGTKWFVFYTKFRPWFVGIMELATITVFLRNIEVYINNFGLLVVFILSIIEAGLAILVAMKSKGDYQLFVSFINGVLAFEVICFSYQFAIQQYYVKGDGFLTTLLIGLVVSYLFWYRPNMKYFKRRLIKAPTMIYQNESAPVTHVCYSAPNDSTDKYIFRFNSGEELILGPDKKYVGSDGGKTTPKEFGKKAKYCSRCGRVIDPITKKCTGCGKQYFKGISAKKVLIGLILIVSLTGNVVLYLANSEMQERIPALENRITALEKENTDHVFKIVDLNMEISAYKRDIGAMSEEIAFYDEHVVFVEDDGTNFYHRYDCYGFQGNSYWAYNIEAASGKGYKPCPRCHE